jgi:hypothetical protein
MTSIAYMFVIVTLRLTYLLSSHGETTNVAHDRLEGDCSCLSKVIGYSGETLFSFRNAYAISPLRPAALLVCVSW